MSKCLVAAIQSTQTLARRQSSAGLLLRFIQFACQTNLTGVPSQGRCWECIKTVKMATVTYSWHFLHLGMISTFDILQACPKIIILQLDTVASCCSPLVMNILHHPPPFQSAPDFHLCLSSSLPWLFIHLLKFLSIPSSSSAHHLPSFPLAPSSTCRYSLSLCLSLWCNQLCLLSSAEPGLFSCSHDSGVIYLHSTHSPVPFLFFSSPHICLYVSCFSLLSTYSCHLLH